MQGRIDRLRSRRRALRVLFVSPFALAVAALPSGRAPAQSKQSKEEAQYQDSPKDGQKCRDCALFIEGGSCQVVEGSISPEGWCRFLTPK